MRSTRWHVLTVRDSVALIQLLLAGFCVRTRSTHLQSVRFYFSANRQFYCNAARQLNAILDQPLNSKVTAMLFRVTASAGNLTCMSGAAGAYYSQSGCDVCQVTDNTRHVLQRLMTHRIIAC